MEALQLLMKIIFIISIIFGILMLDLFHADKTLEYSHKRKKNLTDKMYGDATEWLTKEIFWRENSKYFILCLVLAMMPIISIFTYIYYLHRLKNSNYEFSNNNKDIDIMLKGGSINSYILPWI